MGYARTANTIRGVVPNIDTFAILTAENPNSVQLSRAENQKRNDKLEQQLSNKYYGYRKAKGKYGNPENTFFVPDITKSDAMFSGREWEQNTTIFAEEVDKEENNKSYKGMKIDLLWTFPKEKYGHVDGTRYVFINQNDIDDNYSIVKGKKVYIPFYDDESGKKTGTNVTNYERAYWNGGKIDGIQQHFESSDIEEINNYRKESFDESKIEKYRRHHRGITKNKMNKLNYGW